MVENLCILYISVCGDKVWCKQNEKIHRLNGPAMQFDNGTRWFQNNKPHRLDGPAKSFANGVKQWFYHGKHIRCYTQEEFERLIKLRLLW